MKVRELRELLEAEDQENEVIVRIADPTSESGDESLYMTAGDVIGEDCSIEDERSVQREDGPDGGFVVIVGDLPPEA